MIFRLIQECLTNVHRHSGSKTASIRLARKGDMISLEVRDTGKGISPERLAEIQTKNSGVGIRGMRERVQQFNGEMKIGSDHTGTRVSVTFSTTDPSTERKQPHPAQFQGGGYPGLYANPHR